MVAAVARGASLRVVAALYGVSPETVRRWVLRAASGGERDAGLGNRSSAPARQAFRTAPDVEDEILVIRRTLKEESALGEYGAAAIRRELVARAYGADPDGVPSLRTIGRILERRGALDARRRVRHPAPPAGWYLPDLAARRVELDAFDTIEGLRLRGGTHITILTGISLHGGLADAWPAGSVTTDLTMLALAERWRRDGLPAYAQFDNDVRFEGSHGYRDLFGRLVRFCLALGVTPVFAPIRQMGFQAAIESFNGRWQAKVWDRFWSPALADLQQRSAAFVEASWARSALRIEMAPVRRPWPDGWEFESRRLAPGRVVFIRRTGDAGTVEVLGRAYLVDPTWQQRLVRAEIDLAAASLTFTRLRRRDPGDQPVLRTYPYRPVRERIYTAAGVSEVVAPRHHATPKVSRR
jgi:hypothetical protein